MYQGTNVITSLVSEDCLTINVLRAAGIPANASLLVMAWIYGGGFTSDMNATFNGSAIVAKAALRGTPVIYVDFNYRTGP
jgi:acetylcholinesterase